MPDGTQRHTWKVEKLGAFFSQSSFATRAVVKARNAVKINPAIDLGLAAPFGCGVQTGAGIVLNSLRPEFGTSIGVFGCGTVGMSAIMAARIAGCRNIVAVGGNARSLELALELGATHAVNRRETADLVQTLRDITGCGLDYAVDTSGVTGMIEVALDTLHEIGATNEKLFVCTPDVGMNLKQFRQSYPERYIDVGIAEQNCVGVAAGLALAGNIPVIMGMLPFLSMRACEQVRTAVCYQNLPVRIIGTGGGLTSGGGSTHNAMEDIAIVKSMVNMTVISICDPNMIRDILHLSRDYPGRM